MCGGLVGSTEAVLTMGKTCNLLSVPACCEPKEWEEGDTCCGGDKEDLPECGGGGAA